MTFYQFVQRELEKRCSQCRETDHFWVYEFDRKNYPYSVAFPKLKAFDFLYYYGLAIRELAVIIGDSLYQGITLLATQFDEENQNAKNDNQD